MCIVVNLYVYIPFATFVVYSKQFVCVYIYFILFCLSYTFVVFVTFVFDSVFDDHFFIHGCTLCDGFTERLINE
jgi:hypothetical protein